MLFVRPVFSGRGWYMFIGAIKAGLLAGVGIGLTAMPTVLAHGQAQPQTPRWISSTVFFENANACKWAGIRARVCESGYRSAYRQHVRIAPAYREQADCEADFIPGECFVSGASQLWTPWLSGFSLITHARLPPCALHAQREPRTPMASLNKSWAQQLQEVRHSPDAAAQVRFFSEPLYWERDHQGGFHLTTLREKLRNGERFANAFSKRPPVTPGSPLWTRQLARIFEPQRLVDVAIP